MLTITQDTVDALRCERLKHFAPRVDAWMQEVSPGWADRVADERLKTLHDLLLLADRSGMKVETDYALLALIFVNSGRDPERFGERREVRDVLEADWAPASKVMRLYELAFNMPAAPS